MFFCDRNAFKTQDSAVKQVSVAGRRAFVVMVAARLVKVVNKNPQKYINRS